MMLGEHTYQGGGGGGGGVHPKPVQTAILSIPITVRCPKPIGYLSAAQLRLAIVTAQNSIINQFTHGTTELSRDPLPNA